MKVGIDASNLNGGAFHHLLEILRHDDPRRHGITQVVVWGSTQKLTLLPDFDWLVKLPQALLDKSILHRIYWTALRLNQLAQDCDVLFLPGANYATFHPQVAMCHNLLPFDTLEKQRYGFSQERLRLELLRYLHGRVFRQADGLIFVSQFSKQRIEQQLHHPFSNAKVIYHGCSSRFGGPRQRSDQHPSPTKLLYVSSVDEYKHQDKLVEGVFRLVERGYRLELTLIGKVFSKGMLERVQQICTKYARYPQVVQFLGEVPHESLPAYYQSSDLFVYPSTCETFGLTLVEAMRNGLPIVCTGSSSLPEVAGRSAIFFDGSIDGLVLALERVVASPSLRNSLSKNALTESERFNWATCAASTWSYLAEVYHHF